MEPKVKKLTTTGIPIAKRFRTLGYNVRANIDNQGDTLLFEMRDFHRQLRFDIGTSAIDIIRSIKYYIATNTSPYIEEVVQKRQIYRSNNNQEIIQCKHLVTTNGYTLI